MLGGQHLSLPPTPSDFELVELVQQLISRIRQRTESLMRTVGDNAFGFTAQVARNLTDMIDETYELCRRCEHALSICNVRAAAAVGLDSGDLLQDAAKVMTTFDEVARAARSTVLQVCSTTPTPTLFSHLATQSRRTGSNYSPFRIQRRLRHPAAKLSRALARLELVAAMARLQRHFGHAQHAVSIGIRRLSRRTCNLRSWSRRRLRCRCGARAQAKDAASVVSPLQTEM